MRYRKKVLILLLLAAILFITIYMVVAQHQQDVQPTGDTNVALSVIVIDVGKADSILVSMSSGETMLIDAAEASDTDAIFEELDERGITDIDIMVATHPHADHIGGISSVIESYDIGMIYMPDVTSDSKTYENMIETIHEYDIPVHEAYAGLTFSLGDAKCTIVSPDENADEDKNNESVVIYLDYLETEFLFTGDMEEDAEQDLLEAGYLIDADVLKVAHHGSSTGTTQAFLSEVSPQYAAISCGANNKYKHPHEETLALLDINGVDTFRTDVSGDIMFITNGYDINVVLGDKRSRPASPFCALFHIIVQLGDRLNAQPDIFVQPNI